MNELYEYLNELREQAYKSASKTVTIDIEHYFRLFQLVCYMMQIRNIVNYDDNVSEMLKLMKDQAAK